MKRLLTIPMLIVGSTLLVACQTPDGPDEPTVTAEPTSGPAPTPTDPVSQGANIPQFTLQTDSGERLGGTPGGYCWGNECLALEVQPEPKEFHNLPYGPLVVEFDGQIPGKVYLTLSREGTYGEAAAQTEVTPDAPWVMWDPQVEPGQYVLAVNAYWENDDNISYYFGLRITPPETHTLDLPRPPAAFLITPDGQRIEGITGSYCWNGEPDEQGNMTAVCADMAWLPVHEVFAPLAAGRSGRAHV